MITLPKDILQHISLTTIENGHKTYKHLLASDSKTTPYSLVSLDVKISLLAPFTTFLFSYKTTIISFHKAISLELTTES